MSHKVRMPKIDANVEEASIGSWIRDEGEWVEQGQPLAEIITDKANFELESPDSGYLRRKVASEKSVVPTGYVIAVLTQEPEEPMPDFADENKSIMEQHREQMLFGRVPEATDVAEGAAPEKEAGDRTNRQATPAARRKARKNDVSIEDVPGGKGGIVREADVDRYISERSE